MKLNDINWHKYNGIFPDAKNILVGDPKEWVAQGKTKNNKFSFFDGKEIQMWDQKITHYAIINK